MNSNEFGEKRDRLCAAIDHTLLRADARSAEIIKLCREAREYRFHSVCVYSSWAALCKEQLTDSGVVVCTVVGFPSGAQSRTAKAAETADAIAAGAGEIDMVIAIGRMLDGDYAYVRQDIAAVVAAAERQARVKVILETGHLDQEQITLACQIVEEAGADFVKTSTGFGPRGASVEDVRLMRASVGNRLQVKASGGIRDTQTAMLMLDAGADRLGTSASVAIVGGGSGGLAGY